MDHLATVADTCLFQNSVEAFRCRFRATGEKLLLYLAREEREQGRRKRNAAKRLRCFPTDDDIAASALFHFAVDLECLRQPHAGGGEHANSSWSPSSSRSRLRFTLRIS